MIIQKITRMDHGHSKNNPLRVLIITNTLSKRNLAGGVEVVVKHHAEGLTNLGFSVKILATTPDLISENDIGLNSSFTVIPSKSIIKGNTATTFSFRFFWQFIKLNRDSDLVHIHLCKDFLTLGSAYLLKLMRKNFVIQTHGVFSRSDRMRDRIFNFLAKKVAKGAQLHFTLTTSEEFWFAEQGWKTKMVRIRNPIPVISDIREESLTYDLVFLSRFQARKRPQLFVEAVNLILQVRPNIHCRMSGIDQGEFSNCMELISKFGIETSIEITDEITSSEIQEILTRSKIMILPSYSEYVPMIILESLMAGTPVIAGSDCELAAELNGLGLCSLADSAIELSLKALRLLEDETEYLLRQSRGKTWVIENCSIESVCSFLGATYQELGIGSQS